MARKSRTSSPSLFDFAETTESSSGVPPPPGGFAEAVALHEAAQSRYLNYALSVITSRALPDVRDGLKPVQRRFSNDVAAETDGRRQHRKCAKVRRRRHVGASILTATPAVYETLVRMAQPFALRYPLVDGSGNFGRSTATARRPSVHGVPPGAHCRQMLAEIDQRPCPSSRTTTAEDRAVVLRANSQSAVNGTTGIAVGMATNVPPHNLAEVCAALVKLLDNPDLSTSSSVGT